ERWRILLRPVGAVSLGTALSATLLGFGASMVLPLRLGEIVRPAFLARRAHVALPAAVSSVVLERLFDVLFVIGCFLAVNLVSDVPEQLRRGAIALGTLAVVGFVVLIIMERHREATERLVRSLLRVLPSGAREFIWRLV